MTPPADHRPLDKDAPVLTPTQSRGAIKTGHVRYILGISLFLAVAAMIGIWVFGAF